MKKNEIINIEKIPKSAKKESSYKNFPIPEIIYKPNNKIFLFPRIKNLKNNNIELYKNICKNNDKKNNKVKKNISNSNKKEEICLSENNRINPKNRKNSIHSIIINSKNYPLQKYLHNNKQLKINNFKKKSILSKNNYINKNESSSNNSNNSQIKLKKNVQKITITSDKMYNRFKDGISKLKKKPLELVIDENNINHNYENKCNDIFKTTQVLPTIKLGCKYDQVDNNNNNNTEEEKNEYLEKLKKLMHKINKKNNNKSRNAYSILDNIKKKKTYDCERLIQKTSEEVKKYQERINYVYNNLKKTFDKSNNEWNYYDFNY